MVQTCVGGPADGAVLTDHEGETPPMIRVQVHLGPTDFELEECSHDDEVVSAMYRLDEDRSEASGRIVYVPAEDEL